MEERIKVQLREVFRIKNQEIREDDLFREFEGWDSMTGLSLVAMLDSEFDVLISAAELRNLKTVGNIIEIVKQKTHAK